eukprot:GSMAST32.ASY1.ANO1.2531.1 assembled CDS
MKRLCKYLDSLGPSLEALSSLLSLPNRVVLLPRTAVIEIVTTIFNEVHVPQLKQLLRQQVFDFLLSLFGGDSKNILKSCSEPNDIWSLSDMGDTLAFGICRAIEGEKDPRCLVVCLRLIFSTTNCKLTSGAVEELFDIAACYFPITFTPPPDDPYGISKDCTFSSLLSNLFIFQDFFFLLTNFKCNIFFHNICLVTSLNNVLMKFGDVSSEGGDMYVLFFFKFFFFFLKILYLTIFFLKYF